MSQIYSLWSAVCEAYWSCAFMLTFSSASDFGSGKKRADSEPMYTMPPIATKHLESAYGAKHLDESSAGHFH